METIKIKDLVDSGNILSHVILGGIDQDITEALITKYQKEGEEMSSEIPIELKIGGHVVDVRNFFDMIWKQYESMVTKKAEELVASKGSKNLAEFHYKIQQMAEVVEQWESEINWEIRNILK